MLALNNILTGLALPNYYIIKTPNQINLSNSERIEEIYAECKKASLQGYISYDFVYLIVLQLQHYGAKSCIARNQGLSMGRGLSLNNSTKAL